MSHPHLVRLSLPVSVFVSQGLDGSTCPHGAEGGRVRPGTRLLWRHVGQVEEFILTRSRASRGHHTRDGRGCRASQTHSTFKACEDTMTTPVPVAKTSHVTKPKVWGGRGVPHAAPRWGHLLKPLRLSPEICPSIAGGLSVWCRSSPPITERQACPRRGITPRNRQKECESHSCPAQVRGQHLQLLAEETRTETPEQAQIKRKLLTIRGASGKLDVHIHETRLLYGHASNHIPPREVTPEPPHVAFDPFLDFKKD